MATVHRTSYGSGTRIPVPFGEAVERTKRALADEGFGVLSEIDVRKTLKEKLDVDLRPYLILGACNPPLAHRALTLEPGVGLLLPCNVVVREDDEGTVVEAIDPEAALAIVGDRPELREVAREAKTKLERALERLAAA